MNKTISSKMLVGSVLLLAAFGAWISGQLVKQHAGRWTVGGTRNTLFERVCDATKEAGLDCVGASKGPWSVIRMPLPVPSRDSLIGVHTVLVPVAFLGLAYFVFMGVWFGFIGRPRPYGYRWHRVPLGAGFCGLAVSLFYLAGMAAAPPPRCVWCLAVHGINLLMVLAVWRMGAAARRARSMATVAFSEQRPERIARATLTSREALSAIAFSLILIAGLWAHRREQLAFRSVLRDVIPYKHLVSSLRDDSAFLLREFHAQPQHRIPQRSEGTLDSGDPQLAVFTDFECPACYCNSLRVRNQIAEKFQGRLRVQVRHFPLSSACNPNVREDLHPNACEAAYAAEAARLQGGNGAFRRMHDLLFENRQSLGRETYCRLAMQAGLDADLFMEDMNGDVVREVVRGDIRLATELGVTRTPSMFLDGRRIPKLCRIPVFWEAFAEGWRSLPRDGLRAGRGNRDAVATAHSDPNHSE